MNTLDERPHAAGGRTTSHDDDLRALRKREWAVLGLLLVVALVAFFNVKRVVVNGVSMQPTFKNDQSVLVWTSVPRTSLREGDIIVFHSPDGDEFIKRIVFIQNRLGSAQPPEQVWTTDGDQPFPFVFEYFYRNGKHAPLDRPTGDRRIWVLGDNYNHSEDSRDFGPIAPQSVLGKVIM